LREIAKAQARVGEVEEADKTFREILNTAREISHEYSRVNAMREIAEAQAATGRVEEADKTFEEAIKTARKILYDQSEREVALSEIAKAQAAAGRVVEAIKTIQLVLVESEKAIIKVAEVCASRGAKDSFKQLLAPASYHISASYKMCGLLPQLYADDEGAIDKIATLVMT
jgi:tetratricopeptide (TPR) repeat protein